MPTPEAAPRVAVVGFGPWGRNHARAMHRLGALAAICDSDEARLDEARKLYPGVETHTSFGPVAADPRLQAVVLAVPAELHATLAAEAMRAHKDCLVEKPLALSAADGDRLLALSRETGTLLMVGHILHYHPAAARLAEIVAAGELGRLHYIYSSRLNLGRFRREENSLWSFAPHDISLILSVFGEDPTEVTSVGGNFLRPSLADVTMTNLAFASGVRAHIFVSWLHPYKEQRFVVIGDRKMAVFDDIEPERKLVVYPHAIDWVGRQPVPRRAEGEVVAVSGDEPLLAEDRHFLACITNRTPPLTGAECGVRVLRVLDACQRSLEKHGAPVSLMHSPSAPGVFVHDSAIVDSGAEIGDGTRIWHFCHISNGAQIGKNVVLGQNVFVAGRVIIGDGVKVQNNVSLYDGVEIEADAFLGPSVVLTNVRTPRSPINRKSEFAATRIRRGATIGANATVVCGVTLGAYSFVGAGAVVTHDVPAYGLVYGNPATLMGFACACGERLDLAVVGSPAEASCGRCGACYVRRGAEVERQ
ncbi:MAG: Gfo/Idh/MocA family oxidoreductase [Deltaproteobacteria bacterium]|nr:Gfo/Idh/MocA family oxidoreductase [Deltaproteobacteria bacterium]